MIDKVPESFDRIGWDLNPHTIKAMVDIRDIADSLPARVSESEYAAMKGSGPARATSWVRFVASFGGKFEAGYARSWSRTGEPRNYVKEAKRNAIKQQPKIQGVKFLQVVFRLFNT